MRKNVIFGAVWSWQNKRVSSLTTTITARLRALTGIDPELRPATKPEFGHYQSNVALRLGQQQGRNPREVAGDLASQMKLDDICLPAEIAGPGFLNFRLRPEALARAVTALAGDEALGIVTSLPAKRVVIDYSSPNVAKQMHIGHLRTTIIGDCFTRVLRATGDTVIPQNHIGDWTPVRHAHRADPRRATRPLRTRPGRR